MKKIITYLVLCVWCTSNSQVTLRITSIPNNTPEESTIYLAGTINTWDPSSAAYTMQSDGLGAWQIIIPEGDGTVEYKFTRGSWSTVEGNATGGFLANRSFTFTGVPQIINLTIQSWEDISGSGSSSTVATNVQILSNSFFMPQLDRNRKIWIYLPPDYFTTTKTYPVLYMEDGQNLFDNATSFSGEWQIDETLNSLFNQGNYGAIVVGIDNGGSERLNEYSPWNNPSYGGGQGELYMQFLAETLKPYIDTNFRTKPQAQYNALIGSSMGALISTYGAVKYPNLFSKVGVFSPAFWFVRTQLNNYINLTTNDISNLRLYFVAGQNEDVDMVPDMNNVKNNLIAKGVVTNNTFTKIDAFGTHTESYWRGEFAESYLWLFMEENLNNFESDLNKCNVFQMNTNQIFIDGLREEILAEVYTIQGEKLGVLKITNGINEINLSLSKGVYFIKSKLFSLKIVK